MLLSTDWCQSCCTLSTEVTNFYLWWGEEEWQTISFSMTWETTFFFYTSLSVLIILIDNGILNCMHPSCLVSVIIFHFWKKYAVCTVLNEHCSVFRCKLPLLIPRVIYMCVISDWEPTHILHLKQQILHFGIEQLIMTTERYMWVSCKVKSSPLFI